MANLERELSDATCCSICDMLEECDNPDGPCYKKSMLWALIHRKPPERSEGE